MERNALSLLLLMDPVHGEKLLRSASASTSKEHGADPLRPYRIFQVLIKDMLSQSIRWFLPNEMQLLESLSALEDPKPFRLMRHIHHVATKMSGVSWYHIIWACLSACWKITPWALFTNLFLQLIVSFSNILAPKFFQVVIDAFSHGPPTKLDFLVRLEHTSCMAKLP